MEVLDDNWLEWEEIANAPEKQMMVLSMNAFLGVDTPTTTKLSGHVGDLDVTIMIDSGATHNFIAPHVITSAKLSLLYGCRFQVLLGTGVVVDSLGLCRQVAFSVQDASFTTDFVSLELGGADMILGVQWLRTLGKCLVDWERHEFPFFHRGQKVTLRGDPTLHSKGCGAQAMSCSALSTVIEGELCTQQVQSEVTHPPLQALLDQFQRVFEVHVGLPPVRGREHMIILQHGVTYVSVRPYQYPQASKAAMDVLVQEMLQSGIIRLSCIPFSSPVLLVRKKDNTSRFCVDYRALNRVTMADKYLIVMIDQLLDELHGLLCSPNSIYVLAIIRYE